MKGAGTCTAAVCGKPLSGPVGWCPYCGAQQTRPAAHRGTETPAQPEFPPRLVPPRLVQTEESVGSEPAGDAGASVGAVKSGTDDGRGTEPGTKTGKKTGKGVVKRGWRTKLRTAVLAVSVAAVGYGLFRAGEWLEVDSLWSAPARRASLTVLSEPPRGIVRIDGIERGYAPVTVEVEADRLVQVSVVGISGRQPRTESLSLSPGESRTVTFRLPPRLGGL